MKCQSPEASGKFDDAGEVANVDAETTENTEDCTEGLLNENIQRAHPANDDLEAGKAKVGIVGDGEISAILKHMRLEEEKEDAAVDSYDDNVVDESTMDDEDIGTEGDGAEICSKGLDESEISSQTNESVGTTLVDDSSSEQSWMLRSLSDSSVACVTSDFAMQNVILQMGLRLLAPGGMQIRQLHRYACFMSSLIVIVASPTLHMLQQSTAKHTHVHICQTCGADTRWQSIENA